MNRHRKESGMARPRSTHPTASELEVLNILWERGASTLREIHEALRRQRDIGLTTTLKKVQIMEGKGWVIRDGSARPCRYNAGVEQGRTRGGILAELVRTVFAGSGRRLLVQAVQEGMIGEDELREAQKIISGVRKGKGAGRS
jgi:BlaI family transcriptional regulator, penicillinase repressor